MVDGKVVDLGGVKDTLRGALIAERESAAATVRQLVEQLGWDLGSVQKYYERRDFEACKKYAAAAALNVARLTAALDHASGIPDDPKCPDGLTLQEQVDWHLRAEAADARARKVGADG